MDDNAIIETALAAGEEVSNWSPGQVAGVERLLATRRLLRALGLDHDDERLVDLVMLELETYRRLSKRTWDSRRSALAAALLIEGYR